MYINNELTFYFFHFKFRLVSQFTQKRIIYTVNFLRNSVQISIPTNLTTFELPLTHEQCCCFWHLQSTQMRSKAPLCSMCGKSLREFLGFLQKNNKSQESCEITDKITTRAYAADFQRKKEIKRKEKERKSLKNRIYTRICRYDGQDWIHVASSR